MIQSIVYKITSGSLNCFKTELES